MPNRCTAHLQWNLTGAVEGRLGERGKEPELTLANGGGDATPGLPYLCAHLLLEPSGTYLLSTICLR